VAGTISIYFEYYPHTAAGRAAGTLVATEGGPGFPATESRDDYLALFEPLRATRDVVLMDNRGTGRSGAVGCLPLQTAPILTEADIGACGRSLGPKAALYSTALAADDLAAILAALSLAPVDLYGDSYGTYFAQVFAVRHPDKLRSLVLDGAYPLNGPDYAWYPNYAPAMREKFNLACKRSPECSAVEGSSMDHIAPALRSLRAKPFSAQAHDGDGRRVGFNANAKQLAAVMFGSAPAYATVREVDAAARAFSTGDRLPLLRLMAETLASVDSRDETMSPAKFSAGLAAAVMCQDPPQIFDMKLSPELRVAARDRAIARRKAQAPDTYAPFTIDEYRGMPLDYAFIDECVQWPVPPASYPASHVVPANASFPALPVLVLSGELDNMTGVADGTAAAKQFPHARHVIIANGFHVNALPHARSECGATIVRGFIESLKVEDRGCAGAVPEVRLVPRFAQHVHELTPANARSGNAADDQQLRAVTAALLTAGDVIARIGANTTGKGVGLRGGTFTIQENRPGYRLVLRDVRWTEDLAVSGVIDWPGRSGFARADLKLSGEKGLDGALELKWQEGVALARAQVLGNFGRRAVLADTAAP
jgi:pimeloyl-ACP methyl ester carboxylesterase